MPGTLFGICTVKGHQTLISLRATLPDHATLPGKSGLPGKNGALSVSGAPGPISTEAQGAAPTAFASLLEMGITTLPMQAPDGPAIPEDGKILPDGKLPGKLLPVGTELPGPLEAPDNAPAKLGARPEAEHPLQPENPQELTALQLTQAIAAVPLLTPQAQPSLMAAAEPAMDKAKAALPHNTGRQIDPAAVPQTPPTSKMDGANQQAQAVQAPAVQAAQVVQQAKPGLSSTRRTPSSANPPILPNITVSAAQFISSTSTRDALDMPRSLLASAMTTTAPGSVDPVFATGVTSAAANLVTTGAMAPASITPRDFEALIDRLAQARETAQPGAGRVSLPHSEFGQVNLRFDASLATGASSMTVTMTSHDPDFAVAARTALAERAALAPEQARNEANSGRNDNSNNGNGSGQTQGQPQNQAQGQMHGQTRPASNNSGRNPEDDPAFDPEHPVHDQRPNRGSENRGLYA